MRGFAALIAVATATPAMAALPPCAYDQLVAEAVMIMQITPRVVDEPAAESTLCRVEGEITRAFLGPHPVGTVIETMIPCRNGWTDAAGEPVVMVGPELTHDRAALLASPVIELHIAPTGGPAGYGAGVVLLDAPTAAPAYVPFCGE